MAIFDGLRNWLNKWLEGGTTEVVTTGGENERAYVVGPGTVQSGIELDSTQFSPAEYGEYIASSNAVYTCTTLRADLLTSVDLRFYNNRNGLKVPTTGGAAGDLLRYVNPFWTLNRLLKMTVFALDLWGVSFWFMERGATGKGRPKEIWWARPDRVRVVPDENNYIKGFLYYPPFGGPAIFFTPDETIWIPNPNPLDEFNGLAPLAAARLGADYVSAGMKTNMKLFEQGFLMGGLLIPEGVVLQPDQAEELEKAIARRFSGQDKAHRIGVLRFAAKMEKNGVTPHEAEWLEGLKYGLEDVSRAYHIPLDLIGGQRSYENFDGAMKAVWTLAIIPLGKFLAEELQEKFMVLFPGSADEAGFDFTQVVVLQEDRSEVVRQMRTLWDMGVPLNQLLTQFLPHLLPESGKWQWGDMPSFVFAKMGQALPSSDAGPVGELGMPEDDMGEMLGTPGDNAQRFFDTNSTNFTKGEGEKRGRGAEEIVFGGEEHQRIWQRAERRRSRWEKRFAGVVGELFKRQMDSVIGRLTSPKRAVDESASEPFDMAFWAKEFREGLSPLIVEMVEEVGQSELDSLGLRLLFDIERPEVVAAMARQAQRFAQAVNEETWNQIRGAIVEGLQAGEGIQKIQERLGGLLEGWLTDRAEKIARTETVGATTEGDLGAWEQSGVVTGKQWISALQPKRTRDSHKAAHGQIVGLGEDFYVGGGQGQGPGRIGLPEEDINCLCTMVPVVEGARGQASGVRMNGHGDPSDAMLKILEVLR